MTFNSTYTDNLENIDKVINVNKIRLIIQKVNFVTLCKLVLIILNNTENLHFMGHFAVTQTLKFYIIMNIGLRTHTTNKEILLRRSMKYICLGKISRH